MNLINQYLAQSITAASNSLRLTTHQLEAVGLLRECLVNSADIGGDIMKMKKITELSTLAIRLSEIYNYLEKNKIDFFKFSEKFKEHSQYLISDLNHLLEIDNPEVIKAALRKLNGFSSSLSDKRIKVNLTDDRRDSEWGISGEKESEDENNDIFKSYEDLILKPVKPIENMLKKLAKNEVNYEDLSRFAEIMKLNAEISDKNGFEIISTMHKIITKALMMIKSRNLMPGKNVIESIRACLIVIVAVVRGKDVDITYYLNKAEDFGKEILVVTN